MQVSAANVAASVVLSVVLLWTWRLFYWVWLQPRKLESHLKKQGLRGTPYTPLVGDFRKSARLTMEATVKPIKLTDDPSARVLPFLSQVVKKYGKNSYSWIGPKPRILVMNPEHIKEVFNGVYDFPKPPVNPLVRVGGGMAFHNGEKWSKHRRIVNPAFHLEKLKRMIPAFCQSCREMINKWDELVLDKESPCEVNVWPWLQSLTSDVISRTAFGSSYDEGRGIFELLNEQSKLAQRVIQNVYIPGWKYIPTKTNKRVSEIDNKISNILKDMINQRGKTVEAGEASNDDLLGLLLESNYGQDQGCGMTIEEVIEECRLFCFAGQETTAILLVWTLILLGLHQEWQTCAREEVLRVLGRENPDFDRLSHLKIVSMILNEVLRLYPPVVMVNRTVNKETKLGEVTLPDGTVLSFPILLIHRDPDLWGADAGEFKPERFADGISKATNNQASFMPFTLGPRICIGQNFSLIEAKIALAMVLQRFSFELSASYTHAPCFAMTLHPQYGAQLILRRI